jgi:hypothetical protein
MDGSAAKPNPRAHKSVWAFMAERMPRTVARMKEARSKGQGAHLDACWRNGVIDLKPGWFWAYEAGVSIGVPDEGLLATPAVQQLMSQFPGGSILLLKDMPAQEGAPHAAD